MLYVIEAFGEGDETTTMTRAVPAEDAAYLQEEVIPRLRELSEQDYEFGPALILSTLARFSYVLAAPYVYWCVEWKPGLLTLRFAPDGGMQWAALPSPNPEFGGREATEEEMDDFDEDAEDPQYNLVFDSWDDTFDRDREGWTPISDTDRSAYDAALAPVNQLGQALQARWQSRMDEWREICKESPIWRGTAATD